MSVFDTVFVNGCVCVRISIPVRTSFGCQIEIFFCNVRMFPKTKVPFELQLGLVKVKIRCKIDY